MKRVLIMIAVLALVASVPVGFAADFNGDGTNDIGIFRPASGLWAIRGVTRVYFGGSGDDPAPGDYDGDGDVDIAIFRPSSGLWAVKDGDRTYFGGSGDEPLPASPGGEFWHRNGDTINYHGNVAINTQTATCPLTIFSGNALVQSLIPGCGSTYYDGFISGLGSTSDAYLWNYENGELIFGTHDSQRMTIDEDGYIGIGTVTPNYPLELSAGPIGGYIVSFDNTNTYVSSSIMCLKTAKTSPGASTNFIAFYADGSEISSIQGNNDGGIEIESQASPLTVTTNIPSKYVAHFENDGNNSDRYGIRVQCGTDDNSGTNYMVGWQRGDGTFIGSIRSTGGTVTYGTFTGEHEASIPENDNLKGYPYGSVVSLRATRTNSDRPRQNNYDVELSTKPYDKEVFGIYGGKLPEQENLHSVYAIGDGHILVTREGGDIDSGDYLTTSGKAGHAMKQNDDLRHSYTVAKALEPVDWENEVSDSKLIGCTYQTQ